MIKIWEVRYEGEPKFFSLKITEVFWRTILHIIGLDCAMAVGGLWMHLHLTLPGAPIVIWELEAEALAIFLPVSALGFMLYYINFQTDKRVETYNKMPLEHDY